MLIQRRTTQASAHKALEVDSVDSLRQLDRRVEELTGKRMACTDGGSISLTSAALKGSQLRELE